MWPRRRSRRRRRRPSPRRLAGGGWPPISAAGWPTRRAVWREAGGTSRRAAWSGERDPPLPPSPPAARERRHQRGRVGGYNRRGPSTLLAAPDRRHCGSQRRCSRTSRAIAAAVADACWHVPRAASLFSLAFPPRPPPSPRRRPPHHVATAGAACSPPHPIRHRGSGGRPPPSRRLPPRAAVAGLVRLLLHRLVWLQGRPPVHRRDRRRGRGRGRGRAALRARRQRPRRRLLGVAVGRLDRLVGWRLVRRGGRRLRAERLLPHHIGGGGGGGRGGRGPPATLPRDPVDAAGRRHCRHLGRRDRHHRRQPPPPRP